MKYLKSINEFFTVKKEVEGGKKLYNPIIIGTYFTKYWDYIRQESNNYSDDDINKIMDILRKDCSEFLEEIKNSETLLFRGIKRNLGESISNGIWKKEVRKDRSPTDMSIYVSEKFDEHFVNQFGVPLRSEGVFATKNPGDAITYGKIDDDVRTKTFGASSKKIYLFFPIGDYELFWNPVVYDLYSDIEGSNWYNNYIDIVQGYTDHLDSLIWEDWDRLYGDSGTKGQWIYNGEGTGISDYDVVIKKYDLPDGTKLVWEPEMDINEFTEMELDLIKSDVEAEIERLAKGYRSGGLESVTTQEILFTCDNYYIVDDVLYFRILEELGIKK